MSSRPTRKLPKKLPRPRKRQSKSPQPRQTSSPASPSPNPSRQPSAPRRTGKKLLSFDRKLGARYVVGADEAGRGSLAGPLLVAGVLLDYRALRGSRVRPLALLNDSKQLTHAQREELFQAVVGCAEQISVHA